MVYGVIRRRVKHHAVPFFHAVGRVNLPSYRFVDATRVDSQLSTAADCNITKDRNNVGMRDPALRRAKSYNPEDRTALASEIAGSNLVKVPFTTARFADGQTGKPGCASNTEIQCKYISPTRKLHSQHGSVNRHIQKQIYRRSIDIPPISIKSKGTVNEIAPLDIASRFDSRSQCSPQDGGQFHSSVARALERALSDRMTSSIDLPLSDREIETISHLAAGYGAKEIARALNISPRTVEHRIEALKRRFGARNVTHLVAIALVAGRIHSSPGNDAAVSSGRSSPPGSRLSFEF